MGVHRNASDSEDYFGLMLSCYTQQKWCVPGGRARKSGVSPMVVENGRRGVAFRAQAVRRHSQISGTTQCYSVRLSHVAGTANGIRVEAKAEQDNKAFIETETDRWLRSGSSALQARLPGYEVPM